MIDKILKDSWTGRINKTFPNTAQKEKFSIIDFFSKCDQTRWKLRIWSHLLKKSFMDNFVFLSSVTLLQFHLQLQLQLQFKQEKCYAF